MIYVVGSSLFSPAQTTALSGIRPEPLDSLNDECFTRVCLLSSRCISLLKSRFGKWCCTLRFHDVPACLWLWLAAVQQTCPLLTTGFLGQRTVRVKALQLALRTISAALVPPIHAFDGLLGLPGRTASQIELSSHTNCSAKQGLVLDTDF